MRFSKGCCCASWFTPSTMACGAGFGRWPKEQGNKLASWQGNKAEARRASFGTDGRDCVVAIYYCKAMGREGWWHHPSGRSGLVGGANGVSWAGRCFCHALQDGCRREVAAVVRAWKSPGRGSFPTGAVSRTHVLMVISLRQVCVPCTHRHGLPARSRCLPGGSWQMWLCFLSFVRS